MARERTPIDKLVDAAVSKVFDDSEARGTYSYKDEVTAEVLSRRNLANIISEIRKHWPAWRLDQIIIAEIEAIIGKALQKRDSNRIRLYECYHMPGDRRPRWMRMRALTTDMLRAVMEAARTQERDMHLKGEAYEIALDRMEALEKETGRKVRFGDVYDEVVPLMVSARNAK